MKNPTETQNLSSAPQKRQAQADRKKEKLARALKDNLQRRKQAIKRSSESDV